MGLRTHDQLNNTLEVLLQYGVIDCHQLRYFRLILKLTIQLKCFSSFQTLFFGGGGGSEEQQKVSRVINLF